MRHPIHLPAVRPNSRNHATEKWYFEKRQERNLALVQWKHGNRASRSKPSSRGPPYVPLLPEPACARREPPLLRSPPPWPRGRPARPRSPASSSRAPACPAPALLPAGPPPPPRHRRPAKATFPPARTAPFSRRRLFLGPDCSAHDRRQAPHRPWLSVRRRRRRSHRPSRELGGPSIGRRERRQQREAAAAGPRGRRRRAGRSRDASGRRTRRGRRS